MNTRPLVITGMGCVTSFGIGVPKFVEGMRREQQSARFQDYATVAVNGRRFVALAPALPDLTESFGDKAPPTMARATLLALVAAKEAWANAEMRDFVPERAASVISRNFSQQEITARYFNRFWDSGAAGVSGLQFVQTVANSTLGSVAREFSLRGPSTMSLGGSALMTACDFIRSGEADVALVGMLDELSDFVLAMLDVSGCLVLPEGATESPIPYARCGNKIIPGEAAAFFVIETTEHAARRRARPIASLHGCGSVIDDVARENPLQRSMRSVQEAIAVALNDAALTIKDIAGVMGAGSGLNCYDEAELAAIANVFHEQDIQIYSTKAVTGETWGASGGLSVIAAIAAMRDRHFPSINTQSSEMAAAYGSQRLSGSGRFTGNRCLVLSMDMSAEDIAYVCGTPTNG